MSHKFTLSGFRALLLTQFFGALNDNLLKLLVSLLVMSEVLASSTSVLPLILINVCFVIPFVVLAGLVGSLSDRWSKTRVLQLAKVLEFAVAIAVAFALPAKNVPLLLFLLFLMGVHSAIFSPAKYGILPDIVSKESLSRANGILELFTFSAIISGTALGGLLVSIFSGDFIIPGLVVLGIAALGLLTSIFLTFTPAQRPDLKISLSPKPVVSDLIEIRANRNLFIVLLAIGYFWSLGALFQLDLLLYARNLVGLGELGTSLLLAIMGIGIGVGSMFAGQVSYGRVELGLVPIGAAGIGLSSFVLALGYTMPVLVFAAVFVLGVSSGFFIVPLQVFYQQTSPADRRGSYLAVSNFVTYLGMLVSSFFLYFCLELIGISPASVLAAVGLSALLVAAYVCVEIPGISIRCLNWMIARTFYSLRVQGIENVPESGGALIICNHVAYVDPPLLLAAVNRPIRFLMYRPIYDTPIIKPVAKAMGAIPVSQGGNFREMVESLKEARSAIENGELVCIFAEGELTRIGRMVSFKKGFEHVMKGLDAPIIPAFIDQIWGSVFSHKDGQLFWKFPKEIPYPVTVAFGAPMPSSAKAPEVRQQIQEMAAELAIHRRDTYPTLASLFMHTVKREPFRVLLADSSGVRLRALQILAASLAFAQNARKKFGDERMVGVLFPPSVAGALANISLSLAGYVPVNLNYTAGEQAIASAIEQCGIRHVVSSKEVVEKLPVGPLPGLTLLEDFKAEISVAQRLWALILAIVLPTKALQWVSSGHVGARDDLATVIFSSGSTGEPKGVMLSHGNVASNIQNLYDMFQLRSKDGMIGVLPFFHSFGFTATLWLPLIAGVKAVYHHNPLDAGVVGDLVQKERATILMSTPTFLLGYIRKCTKAQFETLRFVVVGAEKLKERVAEAFRDKFGQVPLEGYGCTELSPVAILNVPNFEDENVSQVGHKLGSVGHPLPSVAVRIVDPDSFSLLPPNVEGLLLIRGPNVMLGYLNNPRKTAEVIRDGWYITGDIARLDEDGFVTITDRLSRFSKIAGEMVPHIKIEEAIQKAIGETDNVCAVTAVADEKRGEKLVVLLATDVNVDEIVRKLGDAGLPNLWIPKRENFLRIERLPVLGTGKLDLKGVKSLANELLASKSSGETSDSALT